MGTQFMRTVLKMFEVSHHLADDLKKIDRVFNTLWLEIPPYAFSTIITDLEYMLNGCCSWAKLMFRITFA